MVFAVIDLQRADDSDVLMLINHWVVAESIAAQLRRAGVRAAVVEVPRANIEAD